MIQHLMLCGEDGKFSILASAETKEELIPIFNNKLQQMLDEGFVIDDDWRDETTVAVVLKPIHLLCIGINFATKIKKIKKIKN